MEGGQKFFAGINEKELYNKRAAHSQCAALLNVAAAGETVWTVSEESAAAAEKVETAEMRK